VQGDGRRYQIYSRMGVLEGQLTLCLMVRVCVIKEQMYKLRPERGQRKSPMRSEEEKLSS
jgi:hypothetical protein